MSPAVLDETELRRRLRDVVDVTEDQVSSGGTPEYRSLAAQAVYRTRMRQAADALVALCAAQDFSDVATANLALQVAAQSGHERPVPDILKGLGLAALRAARYDDAVALLERAALHAAAIATRPDPRSRTAVRYWHDREIDAAYQTIGSLARGVANRRTAGPPRFAVLTSTLDHVAATTHIIVPIVRGLRERGHEIVIVSTEHGPSAGSVVLPELQALGVPVILAAGANHYQRVASLVAALERDPVDATLYYHWPVDAVGKLATVVGLSPGALFMNHTCEQTCGRFDVVMHSSSPRQLQSGIMGGEQRFVGPAASTREKIQAAAPFDRRSYGLADDEVVVGTYGRISKCCEATYLGAMASVLERAPRARLVLAGPTAPEYDGVVADFFADRGLGARVLNLGNLPNAYYGLVKMTDVYCDTLGWRGCQSVLEAMVAGVPVVAMRSVPSELDPTGAGPMSNSADLLAPGIEAAPAGDVDRYVELALRYIADPARRAADGAALQRHESTMLLETCIDRVAAALADVAGRYRPAPAALS